jgi:ribose/xylose/arabinose/galactoside ABC-type transport system permease subunit
VSTETSIQPPAAAGRPGIDLARVRAWLPAYGVYAAIVVLIIYNIAFTPNFLAWSNVRIQLIQVAPIVIVALGMALVIGTEGIDLSVGSVMALAAALIPLYLGYGVIAAILVSLVAGVVVGFVNGTLVARVGLQPIVATLALFVGGRGLALVISGGQLKDVRDANLLYLGSGDLLGLPVLVWIAAVLVLIIAFVVRRTVFGRRLLAIGGNRASAELAGLPVRRVLLTVYIVCSVLAAIAGVLAVARIQSSDASAVGLLIELSAITAVVVGGTPLTGGRVRVLGTVAGALLMQLVVATMIKHNLQSSITEMAQAVIILIAVYVARERKTR